MFQLESLPVAVICDAFSTWFMSQSVMQDFFTAIVLLHLHQKLSQVVAQERVLLCLQGSLIVLDSLNVNNSL